MSANSILLIFPFLGAPTEVPDRPPLGLLTIAAPLIAAGYRVTLLDERTESEFENVLLAELRKGPLCAGISSLSGHQIKRALAISGTIKTHSDVPVVFGGVHVSIAPESVLVHPLVDYIVRDDGETAFLNLVESLASGRPVDTISGIGYKEFDQPVLTGPAVPVDITQNLPVPFQLIRFDKYRPSYNWPWVPDDKLIPMETSRGCPFSCSFCTESVRKKKWRALSPERVLADVKHYIATYGINNFTFIDDNFFGDPGRGEQILDLFIEEHLPIRWYTNIRADFVAQTDDRFIEKLAASGCKMLTFGAESGSPDILAMINKKATVEDVLTANNMLSGTDITCHFVSIRGFPEETRADLEKTLLLNLRLLLDNRNAILALPHLIPTPGTKIAEQCLGNKLNDYTLDDWSDVFDLESFGRSDWIAADTYELMRDTKGIVEYLEAYHGSSSLFRRLREQLLLRSMQLSIKIGSSAIFNRLPLMR